MMPTTDPMAPEDFPVDTPTKVYLGASGLVLGEVDAFGCDWADLDSDVWGPKPEPREETGDRAFDHGQWDATRYYGPRSWGINGRVKAPTHAALHDAERRLRSAIGLTPVTVRATEPGGDGFTTARQQGQIAWTEISHTYATWSIGLYAPDPLIYSNLERAFTLSFPTREGGLSWPVEWPAIWDGTVVSGRVQVSNPSEIAVPLHLVVNGPVDRFRLVNTTTREALTINNPNGSTLTPGQHMSIDTGRHQAMLMGTASRRSWASGQWPLVPPGISEFAITGSNTDPTSNITGSYRAVRL